MKVLFHQQLSYCLIINVDTQLIHLLESVSLYAPFLCHCSLFQSETMHSLSASYSLLLFLSGNSQAADTRSNQLNSP